MNLKTFEKDQKKNRVENVPVLFFSHFDRIYCLGNMCTIQAKVINRDYIYVNLVSFEAFSFCQCICDIVVLKHMVLGCNYVNNPPLSGS